MKSPRYLRRTTVRTGTGAFMRPWLAATTRQAPHSSVGCSLLLWGSLCRGLPVEDLVHDFGSGGQDRPEFAPVDHFGGSGAGVSC